MGSNRLEEEMLNETLNTFRNSQDAIAPAQGIRLLDGWLTALQGDPNLDQIKAQLGELRAALQREQPDEHYIRELLLSLASKTQSVAEDDNSEGTWTGGLESLSVLLRNFSHSA